MDSQPSQATTIQFRGTWENSAGTSLGSLTTSITVQQALIRPMIVVPGFMGSWPNYLANGKMVIDPIAGFYNGLLLELQVLGYEKDTTLMRFPYQWYGDRTGVSQLKYDVKQHATTLGVTIDTWWNGKTPPVYAQTNRFDLVTHSTGGLITRQYVANTGSSNKLHTVVLVAIPHRGAPMAFGAWEGQLIPIEEGGNGLELSILRTLWDALAQKSGCYTTQYLDALQLISIPYVDANQLYQYVQGKACETCQRTLLGAVSATSTQTPIGIPLTKDLFPAKSAQLEGRTYLERSGVLENDGYVNVLLDDPTGIGTQTAINTFAQNIVDDGNLFTVYSTNVGTLRKFIVTTDPAAAPLWKNGTAASTWPHRASGGRVGIWLIDAPTTTVDDFGGGTLP